MKIKLRNTVSHILLDENDILDIVCEKNNLNREKASFCVNYVENNNKIPGSWIIQVQAPELKKSLITNQKKGVSV